MSDAGRGSVRLDHPLPLDCGRTLRDVVVRYESWGRLTPERDNVILVCHSLTKTAHAKRTDPGGPPGWWEAAIGPGRMLDTDRYFVLATDTLAAGGSTGPGSLDPDSGRPYALDFPVVTVRDMVRAQRALLDQLGIDRLACVIGGCFGGQQALEWVINHPDAVARQVAIAVTPQTSAHSIAIFAVMRQLIRSDPAWNGGAYYAGPPPIDGLNRAIVAAMPLWMSRAGMEHKFGRRRHDDAPRFTLEPEFEVERFLAALARPRHDIDANALMYLTRAVEYFDLDDEYGSVESAVKPVTARSLLVSYENDWRYPSEEMDLITDALTAGRADATHLRLRNPLGHGAFMFDLEGLGPAVTRFLADEPVGGGRA